MDNKKNLIPLYVITFFLAACSILYELLLAQTVSFFSANTVVWYSLVLGIYLGSMGVGAFIYQRIFKHPDKWESLIKLELVLSLVGGCAVIIVYLVHMLVSYIWINNNFLDLSWIFYGTVYMAIIAIGILTGCELPLLIRLGHEVSDHKSITNRILSIDYFGSLCGAIIFPLVLIAKFEVITIGLMVAFVNLIIAGYLQFTQKEQSFKLTLTTIIFVMFVVCLFTSKHIEQYFLQKYYYYRESSQSLSHLYKGMKGWPQVKRFNSPYQKIDLVYYPPTEDAFNELWAIYSKNFERDPKFPKGYVMFIDGFYQFLLDIENIYHEYFAHVPIILNNQVPKDVLVLGAGDGLLLRELIKYKDIRSITLVEIDEKMIDIARNSLILKYANKNAFEDKRVNVIIHDAFHYLRNSQDTFDAIYLDFPRAKDYNLSKLYSQEFYRFVFRHLNEGGYAVFDAPEIIDHHKDKMWEIYHSTLKAAGFKSVIPFFSTLENRNMKALEYLYPMFDENAQIRVTVEQSDEEKIISGRDKIMEQIISDFIQDHQNSYIMARKKQMPINETYKTFDVEHDILNSSRFNLTLGKPIYLSEIEYPELINSIMRPTLPIQKNKWRVRVPY